MYAMPENMSRPEGLVFYYNDITSNFFAVGLLVVFFIILTAIFTKLASVTRALAMSSFFCSILGWLGYLVTYNGSNLIPSYIAIIFTIITTVSTVLAIKSND